MANTHARKVLCSLAVVIAIGVAHPAEAHPPPFFWMPDLSGSDSRVGFELLFGNYDGALLIPPVPIADAIVLSGDLYAQIAVTDAVSLLGRLPLSYVDYDVALLPGGEESALALGNLTLGAQFASLVGSGRTSATTVGFGITAALPTASDEGGPALAALTTADFYVADAGRFLPDTTTIRLRGDGRIELDALFLQADLGIDIQLFEGGNSTPLFLGLGAGVSLNPYYALLAELTTVSTILDDASPDASVADQFFHTLDIGARYHNPSLMAGLRFYLPLDEVYRDSNMLGIGFDIGGRF